jgi:uncharacterized protein with WD repeat
MVRSCLKTTNEDATVVLDPMDISMMRRYNNLDEIRMTDATTTKLVRWSSKTSFCVLDTKIHKANNDDASYIWYNKSDLMRFREDCEMAKIVFARTKQGLSSSSTVVNDTCGRWSAWGLEHILCKERADIRCNRKREASDAVIEEQQAQREEDEFSPEFIAELYQDVTSHSQRDAHELALRYHDELQRGDMHTHMHTTTDAETTATTKKRPGRMSNFRNKIRKTFPTSLRPTEMKTYIPPSA